MMAFESKLQKTFYADLKKHSLFEKAVNLVKETYKLEVDVNKSKTEFVIKADESELLEFVQTLLESWLERKKKKQSDQFEDRIKMTKENPLSDILDGHVIWVYWGELATKLSSDIYRKEVEKLKFVQEASVSYKFEESRILRITCNFKVFKVIKSKVESLNLLAASDKHDIGKVQTDTSKSHDSKGNGSADSENGVMKANDNNGTSEFQINAGSDNKDKSVTSETSTDNGADLKQNLPLDLRGSNQASDQSPQGSGSKEKGADDKLFCTPSGRIKVFVYEASITKLSGIDAIVNAANEDLKHIGGVAYHISVAAGGDKSTLEKECSDHIKQVKKVHVTKNFTSSAGNMPYKGVIHAVGPMWSDYKAEDCAKDLYMTIKNVLEEADNKTFSKIAFSAISSGIYGVPRRLCAEMYIKGVIDYDSKSLQTRMKEIHFVDIKKDILLEIRDAYRRWQQDHSSLDFKNANSYSSASGNNGSSGQHSQTVRPEGSFRQIPSATLYQKDFKEIVSFQLSKDTSVKVYKWSIVELRDIDAIVCAVNPDFTIHNRQVARIIRDRAGVEYEKNYEQMAAKLRSKTREDVLFCGAGKLAETQQIKYVIHITLRKINTIEDISKIKHLYIQAFETARTKNISKIALPLIGAASLKYASDVDIQSCSQLFVQTLKEVVKERGKNMSVKEVYLVDQDEKIISFVVKAFQEQDQRGKRETDSRLPKSGDAQAWLRATSEDHLARSGHTSHAGEKCQCGKQEIKNQYPNCSHGLCSTCLEKPIRSGCPFCKKTAAQTQIMKTTKANASNRGSNTESKETKTCPSCKNVLTNPKCFPCGHEVHANCIKQSHQNELECPICGTVIKVTTEEEGSKEGRSTELEEPEKCPICMDVLTDPECLPCGHNFHADCIKQSLEYRLACPICGTVMGKLCGNQPEGEMHDKLQDFSLPGYEGCKTIEIYYNMPDGIQKDIHPHPGRRYKGTQRKAFLPDNDEGKKVLKLLKIAFDRKLIFTIGESRTTGKTDIVTWNDIHHKTKATGGPTNFGYPDKTYLSRVQEELAAKGVTEKDIENKPSGCTIS